MAIEIQNGPNPGVVGLAGYASGINKNRRDAARTYMPLVEQQAAQNAHLRQNAMAYQYQLALQAQNNFVPGGPNPNAPQNPIMRHGQQRANDIARRQGKQLPFPDLENLPPVPRWQAQQKLVDQRDRNKQMAADQREAQKIQGENDRAKARQDAEDARQKRQQDFQRGENELNRGAKAKPEQGFGGEMPDADQGPAKPAGDAGAMNSPPGMRGGGPIASAGYGLNYSPEPTDYAAHYSQHYQDILGLLQKPPQDDQGGRGQYSQLYG
jgi:hypothetical protein